MNTKVAAEGRKTTSGGNILMTDYYAFNKDNIRNKREYLKMLTMGQIPPWEIERKRETVKRRMSYADFVYKAATIDYYVTVGNKGAGGWETVDEASDFIECDRLCEDIPSAAKTLLDILGEADA